MSKHLLLLATLGFTVTATTLAQNNTFPASGNVGIGTTSPGNKLTIIDGPISLTGNTNAIWNAASFYSIDSSGHAYAFGSRSGGFSISDETVGAFRFLINSVGNVGIGTTNPIGKLYVGDDAGATVSITTNGCNGTNALPLYPTLDFLGYSNGNRARIRASEVTWNTYGSTLSFLVNDGSSATNLVERMTILAGGNVGIGTTNPVSKLEITSGGIAISGFSNNNGGVNGGLEMGFDGTQGIVQAYDRAHSIGKALWLNYGIGDTILGGNVGIGTTSPTEKLSVKGKIRAQEVIVETTGWSDHVFADSYKLQSLSEVEQHIKTEKHLPGVPSAQEVAQKGVSVGDMQAILLAKIEELTLHQIAQEKRLQALEAENAQLKTQLK